MLIFKHFFRYRKPKVVMYIEEIHEAFYKYNKKIHIQVIFQSKENKNLFYVVPKEPDRIFYGGIDGYEFTYNDKVIKKNILPGLPAIHDLAIEIYNTFRID